MMRTTVLLSMLLLTTACGVVEEKKDAALRHLGQATLNSVFRLASAETPSDFTGRFTQAVVSEASSSPEPAQNAAPAAVSLMKASEPAAVSVPSVSPGAPAEGSFEFAYSRFEDLPKSLPVMHVMVRSGEGDKLHAELTRVAKKVTSEELLVRNETRKQAVAHAKVAAAALAERPRHIADFEVHFAEEFEKARKIPNAPSPPPAPEKECSSQMRTAI